MIRFLHTSSRLLFLGILISASAAINNKPIRILDPENLQIPVYDFEGFSPFLNPGNDTVYIFNFWATWCKPCVEELPELERITDSFFNQKVKVILVNLDMKSNWEPGLINFLKKMQLKSEVLVLYETDADKWIPKVNEDWSGAIPASLIIKGKNWWFHEGKINYSMIENTIKELNKQ